MFCTNNAADIALNVMHKLPEFDDAFTFLKAARDMSEAWDHHDAVAVIDRATAVLERYRELQVVP